MEAKLTVVFVIDALEQGGTERQLVSLLRALDPERGRYILCVLRGSAPDVACETWELGLGSIISLSGCRKILELARRIREVRADVVQTFHVDSTLVGSLAGRLARWPRVVVSVRNLGYWRRNHRLAGRLYVQALQHADAVLANCEAIRRSVIDKDCCDARKVSVLYNGVDVHRFTPRSEQRQQIKRRLGMSGRRVVGMVSNLRPVKSVDVFLHAARVILERTTQTEFVIVGEGPERVRLLGLATELGIRDKVRFLGSVTSPEAVIPCFDVGVLSSSSEGLSNAVLEYMACGVPVVATRVGGIEEVVSHGIDALLVSPGNAAELGAAISSLLANDEMRSKLGAEGPRKMEATFALDKIARQYEQYWRTLIISDGSADPGRREVLEDGNFGHDGGLGKR